MRKDFSVTGAPDRADPRCPSGCLEEEKTKVEASRRVSALLRAEAQAIQDVTNLPLPDLRVLPPPSNLSRLGKRLNAS